LTELENKTLIIKAAFSAIWTEISIFLFMTDFKLLMCDLPKNNIEG